MAVIPASRGRASAAPSPGPAATRPVSFAAWLLALLAAPAAPLAAQDAARVEAIAPLLAAEDARHFQPTVLRTGLVSPDSLVRRTAALAVGRIGDRAGTELLLPLLIDPDTTVQTAAMFALGLLRDSAAVPHITARFDGPTALASETAVEAVTALAKTGGREAAEFFTRFLHGAPAGALADRSAVVRQIALESWRLGPDAPVADLLPFVRDTSIPLRTSAVFSLSRLRPPSAANDLITALQDRDGLVRSYAVRTLTRGYADSAGLDRSAVLSLLRRGTDDTDPRVRVSALAALGTYGDPEAGARLLPFLEDPHSHVQLQAAIAIGQSGAAAAAGELARIAGGRGSFGLRREALLALARVDTAAYRPVAARWAGSADWRERAAAAEAWAVVAPGPREAEPDFLADRDGRVVAAALLAWVEAVEGPDPQLVAAARPLLDHGDAVVRSLAADVLARAADRRDVPALAAMYRRALRDSIPAAALSALGALRAVSRASESGRMAVARDFLAGAGRPGDYLLRRWAEERWPEAARRWGPAYPIETGRTIEDYRDIARRFVVAEGPGRYPHVFVETEQRGTLELELYGPEAPLTVANFLMLVDRRFFDGNQWHRVVPNFVVQDGDPRGDGWGGPGGAIRDEINRRRYEQRTVGMALSGPETGSSQWFITLNPQPHLDGTYTVFGRVVGNAAALQRITPGDVIKVIRR